MYPQMHTKSLWSFYVSLHINLIQLWCKQRRWISKQTTLKKPKKTNNTKWKKQTTNNKKTILTSKTEGNINRGRCQTLPRVVKSITTFCIKLILSPDESISEKQTTETIGRPGWPMSILYWPSLWWWRRWRCKPGLYSEARWSWWSWQTAYFMTPYHYCN